MINECPVIDDCIVNETAVCVYNPCIVIECYIVDYAIIYGIPLIVDRQPVNRSVVVIEGTAIDDGNVDGVVLNVFKNSAVVRCAFVSFWRSICSERSCVG